MYIFSAWKLALILAVLLFSILYLLPTTYDNLYGYLPLWMQEGLKFDVIDDHTLKTSLKETDKFSYPSGKNYRKVVNELSDVLDSQLNKIGLSEVTGDYTFETTAEREFHVKFLSERAKTKKVTVGDLNLYGSLPVALRRMLPDSRLEYGLDLAGGVHLVLAVDVEKSIEAMIRNRVDVIPTRMRAEKIRCRKGNVYGGFSVQATFDKPVNRDDLEKRFADIGLGLYRLNQESNKALISVRYAEVVDFEDGVSTSQAISRCLRGEEILWKVLPDSIEVTDYWLKATVNIPRNRIADVIKKEEYLSTAKEILNNLRYFNEPIEESLSSDAQVVYQIRIDSDQITEYKNESIDQVRTVLDQRVDAFGVASPSIRREANRPRIVVELPGAKDSTGPLRIVKTMGLLEFKLVEKNPSGGGSWYGLANTPPPEKIPEGAKIYYGKVGRSEESDGWYVLKDQVLLTGDQIADAYSDTGVTGFERTVALRFDRDGRGKFAEVTTDNVGEALAVLLDGRVQSAPTIQEPIIGGTASISGNFTFEESQYLANILKSGAFPVGVKIAEERTVGPTLGQQSIDNGKLACAVGMTVVVIFILIYYKMSGFVAVIALSFNMLIVLAALAGFGAALTLPGIAGLVLTIGMSVDANVLIFERIREELRTGKIVWSAIESGYQRAFWTILDANLTTLAVAVVLYNFGTGPVKGFAVTLGIGILASMFTAIVVTREVYGWVIGKKRLEKLSI
ncbi:protein translocase subunit SecD [Candidatus Poribacteria bacterium]|nr:protein translocase subunit SecD [Candidatus Poribacteria bacterium]